MCCGCCSGSWQHLKPQRIRIYLLKSCFDLKQLFLFIASSKRHPRIGRRWKIAFSKKIFYRKSSGDHILKKQREVFLWKEAKNRHMQRSKRQVRCKSTCLRIVRTSSQKDSQTAVTVVKPLGPSRVSVYHHCNSHPLNADDQIPLHCDLGKKMIISFTKLLLGKDDPSGKMSVQIPNNKAS